MSSYTNSQPDLQSMIMCFRVPELQSLLSFAGQNKSGRKQELVNKAIQLLQTNIGDKSIQSKIRDLYNRRCPASVGKIEAGIHERYDHEYNLATQNKYDSYEDNVNIQHPPTTVLPKFPHLPFYQQEFQLFEPTRLTINKPCDSHRSNSILKYKSIFYIEDAQTSIFENSNKRRFYTQSSKSNVQVQLRFVLIEGLSKLPERLPPQINIKVNDQTVALPPLAPQTKAADEPRHFNRPINLTPHCIKPGRNRFTIRWVYSSEHYAFVVNIVQQQSVDDLMMKLRQRHARSVDQTVQEIKKMLQKDADSDISTMCLKVSLLCPLGKMRMTTPARAKTCSHLQCFDVCMFLKMNENKPTWICPVCNNPAQFSDIQIDEYFSQILKQCKEHEIEFDQDGKWKSKVKETETLVIGPSHKSNDNALDLSWPIKSKSEEKVVDEPEIIDLTADSSDDETYPGYKDIRYNNGSVDLVSSPPVSSSIGSHSSRSSASTPYPPLVTNQQWNSDEQLVTPPLPQTPKSSGLPYHVRCSPRDRLRYSPLSPYCPTVPRSTSDTSPTRPNIEITNSIRSPPTSRIDEELLHTASLNQAVSVISGYNNTPVSMPHLHPLSQAAIATALCQLAPTGFSSFTEQPSSYRQPTLNEYFIPPFQPHMHQTHHGIASTQLQQRNPSASSRTYPFFPDFLVQAQRNPTISNQHSSSHPSPSTNPLIPGRASDHLDRNGAAGDTY